jgi:hypothetical protein
VSRGIRLTVAVLATFVLGAAPRGAGSAQHVWQADVSVRAFEVTKEKNGSSDSITAHAVVSTDSGDARAVRLEIMLPVGVGLVRVPDTCQPSPSPVRSLNARVTCIIGDLAVRELRDITITTTGVPSRRRLRFAVFAFSDTPDPLPSNNFAERLVR